MKVCPRCWKNFKDTEKKCVTCKVNLVHEEDLHTSKVDPHFRIIKSDEHKIHSQVRDQIIHEIADFDDSKHHTFHVYPSLIPEKVKGRLYDVLKWPIVILLLLFCSMYLLNLLFHP